MKIEFDQVKDKANIEKHGFSLNVFELLDFDTALFEEDGRREYGEKRIRVYALLEARLCTAVFTPRRGVFRVISFRKANVRERNEYEKRQKEI